MSRTAEHKQRINVRATQMEMNPRGSVGESSPLTEDFNGWWTQGVSNTDPVLETPLMAHQKEGLAWMVQRENKPDPGGERGCSVAS